MRHTCALPLERLITTNLLEQHCQKKRRKPVKLSYRTLDHAPFAARRHIIFTWRPVQFASTMKRTIGNSARLSPHSSFKRVVVTTLRQTSLLDLSVDIKSQIFQTVNQENVWTGEECLFPVHTNFRMNSRSLHLRRSGHGRFTAASCTLQLPRRL